MAAEVQTFVALGANLGDPVAALQSAAAALAVLPGCRLGRCSSLYRSAPVDAGGPDYCNAVVELFTTQPALSLLDMLQKIELEAGRQRPYANAPRTLDLDLLRYGTQCCDTPRLTLPHPRMFQRAFVLLPLAEIAPEHVPSAALRAVAGQRIQRLTQPLTAARAGA